MRQRTVDGEAVGMEDGNGKKELISGVLKTINEQFGLFDAEDRDFKEELIRDILCQIDYQSALRKKTVEMNQEDLAGELQRLSTRALMSWYEAFLHIRGELMFAGYELNGFKVLNQPFDAIRELMKKDPNFDIRQYIF